MNFFSRFPLIISFLLIAFLTSISISTYTYLNVFNKQLTATANTELKRINQRMTELQGTINDFNRRNDPNAIHREVSRLSGDSTMELITIIDEHGIIRSSSLIEYRNTPVSEIPEINNLLSKNIKIKSSGLTLINHNSKFITGLYPLDAISDINSHTPYKKSYLYAKFNLSRLLHELKYRQQQEITQTSLIHFSFLGIGFLLLYISMTTRIKSITFAIDEFSKGKHNSRIHLYGNDEFNKISNGFNKMAAQVSNQNLLLREQEQDLSITLNSIGEAVIATDADGRITRMNPAAQSITGWPLHDALGTSIQTTLKIKDSTERPIENPSDTVIKNGVTVSSSSETILISKDGTEFHVSYSASPIRDQHNDIQGMVLILNDLSEEFRLKQTAATSERLLTSIMDNTPAVIYVKNSDGKFTFINKEFETLFNITKEDIIGKTLFEVFPDDIANQMHRNDQIVFNTSSILEVEETAPHNDGLHTYSTIKFPLIDEHGKIDSVCGISTDITYRKNQELRFYQSQKMESLGKLTGGIAHDYNNMLGIILGYCELLRFALPDNNKLLNYANEIYRACERGSQLSKKLLSFSSSKQENPVSLNINSLLSERKDMLEKTLTARIKLTLNLDDNLWPVNLSPDDLEDAIINISINAMHAMENGGELTIATSNKTLTSQEAMQLELKEGDYILLNITDTGIGMSQEVQDKMFDPFFSSKGSKGTGLGLSQVYGFIQSSNGAIKVHSETGIGTCLSLYFHRDISDENAVESSSVSIEEKTRDLQGNETILVVDDEKSLREFNQMLLQHNGYKVFLAKDANEALDILQKEHIDLLLSDVIMPGMNGYQLATKVQELYPDIKIQLMSGYTDKHHIDLADTSLHKNLLNKPFKATELLTLLRELLDTQLSPRH